MVRRDHFLELLGVAHGFFPPLKLVLIDGAIPQDLDGLSVLGTLPGPRWEVSHRQHLPARRAKLLAILRHTVSTLALVVQHFQSVRALGSGFRLGP